jgi:two-component system response regulator
VEHSPAEVELLLRPLREMDGGAHIEVVRDGEEALDFLFARSGFRHRAGAPVPRLTLLGLKLPRLDGVEVLKAVRGNSRTRMAPVVVLTSSADTRELAQCYELGANSCVQKPVRYDEFRGTIQRVAQYWLGLNQAPPTGAVVS